MMKRLVFAAGILGSSAGMAAGDQISESFEVCVPSGLCALAVTDTDTGAGVYLVKSDSKDLSLIWSGATFWEVSDADYAEVKKLIPFSMTLPAVDPDSGITLERAKGGSTGGTTKGGTSSGSTSSGGTTSGGLISVGNITIGGGGSTCGDCHKGDMREIHKKVLPQN